MKIGHAFQKLFFAVILETNLLITLFKVNHVVRVREVAFAKKWANENTTSIVCQDSEE